MVESLRRKDAEANVVLTDQEIGLLESTVQGTCKTLDEALQSLYGLSEEEVSTESIHALEEQQVRCVWCGWWVEPCDLAEDESEFVCNECAEDS